jgi:hypothetical protein
VRARRTCTRALTPLACCSARDARLRHSAPWAGILACEPVPDAAVAAEECASEAAVVACGPGTGLAEPATPRTAAAAAAAAEEAAAAACMRWEQEGLVAPGRLVIASVSVTVAEAREEDGAEADSEFGCGGRGGVLSV